MFRRISRTSLLRFECVKILNIVAPKLQFATNLTVEMSTRNHEVRDAMENDSLFLRKVSVRWYSELIKSIEIAHKK